MKSTKLLVCLLFIASMTLAQKLPPKKELLKAMTSANAYFMNKWPDVGKPIVGKDRTRPSNIWTRGVYYEGLMALYKLDPQKSYLDYAVSWGEAHKWGLRNGITTRNGDDQCCGQTYIDLYLIDKKEERIRDIKACMDNMVNSDKKDDWSWVDALQMAMPVFAKLGVLYNDNRYYEKCTRCICLPKTSTATRAFTTPPKGSGGVTKTLIHLTKHLGVKIAIGRAGMVG